MTDMSGWDWAWIFGPLALVVAGYGIAFAVMAARSRVRRNARRAAWLAEKPLRDERRRLEEQRSEEQWKAEVKRALALIEDMRVKSGESK